MNIIIIKILGFLIGLFTGLFLIQYYLVEKFEVNTPPVITSNIQKQPSPKVITNDALIPYNAYKYMCINTFFDITKIDNSLYRWYECDLSKERSLNVATNEFHYFTFERFINVKPNTINNDGSYGADINMIELRGPKCFYFANNVDTNELSEFTILMSIKVKEITSKNNILFELAGNTEIINGEKPKYLISVVNLNIKVNDKGNYDFIITIGDVIYSGQVDNIDKTIFINNDFIVIGLIYTSTDLTFLLNKQVFKYTTKDKFKVKLGSTPLIINKQGLMNIQLYSFVYYKTPLPSNEYLQFFKHNYYYLSGLDKAIATSKPQPLEIKEVPPRNDLEVKLREFEDNLNAKLNKRFEDTSIINADLKYQTITPLDIEDIKNTDKDGNPLKMIF